MRDTAFKRTLATLPLETEVSIEGPFGSFTLHENATRPAVCIAGGIGITPFRSMLLDATPRELPHQVILLYANRRPEDAAFLDELTALKEKNSKFTFVPTMSNMEHSAREWQGERGHIDEVLLDRYVSRTLTPVYYLAGPQGMVTAMRQLLTRLGVSGDDIRFEEFSGY
jgi:ferredoxin-NADP reductase